MDGNWLTCRHESCLLCRAEAHAGEVEPGRHCRGGIEMVREMSGDGDGQLEVGLLVCSGLREQREGSIEKSSLGRSVRFQPSRRLPSDGRLAS